jgi:hypothetical protein
MEASEPEQPTQHNNTSILVNKIKKPRKPTAHEDIVEGFAFLAFKNYEELSASHSYQLKDRRECIHVIYRV